MVELHFEEKHRAELRRMFTELADFVHANHIRQIVGDGPSAEPYTLALETAYRKRYGAKSKRLRVVNLGEVGEFLTGFHLPEATSNARGLVRSLRPRFNLRTNSLLLTEAALDAFKFQRTSKALGAAGLPHKTATLLQLHDPSYEGVRSMPHMQSDYIGLHASVLDDIVKKVVIKRGAQFWDEKKRADVKPPLLWIKKMRQVHAELREIAESVPRKE